ncbi:MAG: hypothetical protein WC860_07550 [Candidatus Margulisiibacteriota bacterium]
MDYYENHLYISKVPFITFLVTLIEFLKGFLPLFILQFFTDNTFYLLLITAMTLIINNWNLWGFLRNQKKFLLIIWGMASFLSPPLFIIFPLVFCLLSFVVNSFAIGLICTILTTFFLLWILEPSQFATYFSLISISIVFLSLNEDFFNYFGDYPKTIRLLFEERKTEIY